jgi:carotenoid cleavage dioxygenase-like enzyme
LIDWQNAFDRVNNQITADPKRNLYQLERQDIDQLTEMDQSVKQDWTKGMKDVCRLEDELEHHAVCLRFCSTYTASNLILMLLKGLEASK